MSLRPLPLGLCVLMASFSLSTAAMPIRDDAFGAIRGLQAETPPAPAFQGKFEPRPGETLIFIGGTNVVDQQFDNHFEGLATLVWANQDLKFRNIAWQADTAFRQQRPLFFYDDEHSDERPGSTPDQRKKITAGTVLVRFGKMESLDGVKALPAFREAYGKFLDQLKTVTERVVVVTPTPFFPTGPAQSLAQDRNEVLSQYAAASRELASKHGFLVVDLFSAIPQKAELSTNGVHLTEAGQIAVAKALITQLGGKVPQSKPAETESLRGTIARKNELWFQYYRPTNWAFLYGDRQWVPSSRDHIDGEKRWFPFEVEQSLTMMGNAETQIHQQAKAIQP